MSIYEIIESVAEIGSTKAKQQIIEDNKTNRGLMLAFLYASNPRFNFYIKADMPVLGESSGVEDISEDTFNDLDMIINRKVTGNDARIFLQSILLPLSYGARTVVCRIVNRDLRCGAGTSIANKVWKGLIPEYPVLLCDKYNLKTENYLKQFENDVGYWVELKEDGGRLLTTVLDGEVVYRSRNGNILNLFGIFDDQLLNHLDTVSDGELVIVKADGKPDRKLTNGFYTKAVRGTLTKEEAKQFTYKLWDMISVSEYESGKGSEPYSVRRQKITDSNFTGNIGQVYGEYVKTLDECFNFYNRMRLDGQEGAIIKRADAVWEDSRSKNYVKLKNESTGDFLVTGVEEGTGKYAGMIGSLICESSCGQIKFNVGTGLTDEDRQKDPSYYISNVVEIKYNEVISSKNKTTKSLFLPVYLQMRFDKNLANSLEELK